MAHPPIDHFERARRRLARAEAHIHYLKLSVRAFLARKPYCQVIHPHPDGIHEIHKLKARRKALPSSFADLSTDALESLRAALDHAMYTIARVSPALTPKQLSIIYFPICATANDLPSRILDCCPGFPQPIVAFLMALKPYQGGCDPCGHSMNLSE